MWNSQSLNNKILYLIQLLEDNCIDFAFVTETWLRTQNNFVTAAINEAGYKITHNIRNNKIGGGVAIVSKQNFQSKYEKLLEYNTFECIIQSFKIEHSNTNLTIILIYRPDSHSENITMFLDEFYHLTEYAQLNFKHFVICGDLNIHFNKVSDQTTTKFCDILDTFSLSQSVHDPTHRLGNTLDLIMHNPENLTLCDVHVDNVDRLSDHSVIFFDVASDIKCAIKKEIQYRNFKNVVHPDLVTDFTTDSTNFLANFDHNNFNSSLQLFNNTFGNTVNRHAPVITKTISDTNRPPWMDNEFLDARRKRRKLCKLWLRTRSDEHREQFVHMRKFVNELSKEKRCNYYKNAVRSASNSQKELFKVTNNLLDRGKKSLLPYSENPEQLATKFNDFFIEKIVNIRRNLSEYSHPNEIVSTEPTVDNSVPKLCSFKPVTDTDVRKSIQAMKIKTCPRDPIPALLLKTSIDPLIPCYVEIINTSLRTGCVEGLKESVVTPILKKAGLDSDVLANYRPVCSGLFVDKLIQTHVLIQLNEHMKLSNLHIPHQSGYKPNHSCETILLAVLNDTLVALDSGLCTVELLLDLSAAFDTVDHIVMLSTLKNDIGLDGTVHKWFSSFLSNRTQAVSILGSNSEFRDMPYGVPQGSVLGPVLFNIYVRNFIDMLESAGFIVHGYADDHQVLYRFRIEFQFHALAHFLPLGLDLVSQWMSSHFLKLNAGKSQLLIFTPKNIREHLCMDSVYIGNNVFIPVSLEALNLGVKLDFQLTFSPHISMVISQSYKQIYNIGQIRKYLEVEDLRTLVQALIVSKMDNCNALLYGVAEYEISRLQKLQNSCARLIYGARKNESVSALLHQLHWLPVKPRIYFKILLIVFKFFQDRTPVYINECLEVVNQENFTLKINRTNTAYGDRAFQNCAPRLWNSLPPYLKIIGTIDLFKKHLKHYLFTHFQEYKLHIERYKS